MLTQRPRIAKPCQITDIDKHGCPLTMIGMGTHTLNDFLAKHVFITNIWSDILLVKGQVCLACGTAIKVS